LSGLIYILIDNNIGSRKLNFTLPLHGIVADELTAISIAEAIGQPFFGKAINDYKPFYARLENDSIWIVYGQAKKTWFYTQYGGCPVFEIQKTDCKVLRVYISR